MPASVDRYDQTYEAYVNRYLPQKEEWEEHLQAVMEATLDAIYQAPSTIIVYMSLAFATGRPWCLFLTLKGAFAVMERKSSKLPVIVTPREFLAMMDTELTPLLSSLWLSKSGVHNILKRLDAIRHEWSRLC